MSTQTQVHTVDRKLILEALQAPNPLSPDAIAKKLGANRSRVYKIARQLKESDGVAAEAEDRGAAWGRLLAADVPLKMRSKALRDLIRSSNPVAVGRALELVLESDGLRKKVSEPSKQTSIIVASSDDIGME